MQLIWISGSTSTMRQIKITSRTVIKLAILSFSTFILIGIGIHFLGFRVAIRFSPEMTKEMGGVITRKELDEIETAYRDKLQSLQRQLPVIESRIHALNSLKEQFSELATPTPMKAKPLSQDN